MIGAKFKSAFSLIEVMVSVALFSVIILTATQIFKLSIDSQRSALAAQNVQESLKYFLEVTGKEIRTAQKNNGICNGIASDEIFVVTAATPPAVGDTLYFKNYHDQCVTYYLSPDLVATTTQRFTITRSSALDSSSDFISPSQISLDSLHFVLNASTSTQPVVTINLQAHALKEAQFNSSLTVQTSITSRYYK